MEVDLAISHVRMVVAKLISLQDEVMTDQNGIA